MVGSIVYVALAAVLAFTSLGGGLYEYLVVAPFWPRRPDLIQPQRGGISRKRFWIPAHTTFEVVLIAALITAWNESTVRTPLFVALASHAAMRIWSAFDFIPRALAFERMDPAAYLSGKTTAKFPLDKSIPYTLIENIVKFR